MKSEINVVEVLNNFSVNLPKSSDRIIAKRASSNLQKLIDACEYLKRDASNEQWSDFHSALSSIKGE